METCIRIEMGGTNPLDLVKKIRPSFPIRVQTPVYEAVIEGYSHEQENLRQYIYEGTSFLTFIYRREYHGEKSVEEIYTIDPDGYLQMSYSESNIDVTIISSSEERVKTLCQDIGKFISETPMHGAVYIMACEGSYYLRELGEVDDSLERGNYPTHILKQYDAIIEDLGSDSPFGRLTILDGEPGVGKSYFIRGLITDAKGMFIYIPSSIAGRITGPDILPTLIREKNKDIPIVLLMEDADDSLATRQFDNIARLGDLLNMSDGLLGDMIDLRIIATTNTKKTDFDPAIMRPGRLNEHVQFGLLKPDHAVDIFMRLTGSSVLTQDVSLIFHSGQTRLADVYREARLHGWKPPKRANKKKVE